MSDPIGSSPSGYEILREIGRGGTAVVYLAHDAKHDRLVALKVLQPNLMLTPERFIAEIRTIAGLQHPHILPLHDSGVWDESPYFVMPYVEGETLADRLARDGELPVASAVRIAREVGDALEYAHRHGIVHRDIKPANILLANDHAFVADFGIAHVIRVSASERVTAAGFAVGTPAYMSPEQAAGERELDGRSDLYSLGCVFYEMLTGTPPHGTSKPHLFHARRVSNPPSLRAARPAVSKAIERVVNRLLEPAPEKRFESAGQFVRALDTASHQIQPSTRRPRMLQAALFTVALLGLAGAAWRRTRADGDVALDRSTYAVFPFRHVGVARNMWLDGDGCARLLHDAMARWEGVRLVDDMRVSDVWARNQPRTVPEAIDAAKALRAGSLAWGEVVAVGDSLIIRAVAYDVSRGPESTRRFVVRLGRETPQLERAFQALADSILVGSGRAREGAASSTRDLRALQLFLDGRAAVDHFDLDLAERAFREAITEDETYAHAHFWLARTLAWRGDVEPSTWASTATHAVALSSALSARDKTHASALLDLSNGQMAEACRRYRTLIAADSLDFAAWFGLGDCNARDAIVMRDARSATGFRFRGSFSTAITAYRRALALVPSFHIAEQGLAFKRLSQRVLYTEESRLRHGILLAPDTQRFGAAPALVAETLAFTPMPFVAAVNPATRPASERQAVRWSAETYRQLTADWVRAFPASADAQENYALAIESSSGIAGSGATLPSALSTARRSLTGTGQSDAMARRYNMVVRLLLKADSISAARVLADSVLVGWRAPTPYQAGYLAGLAALTGRAARAAALLGHAAADSEHVPFVLRTGARPTVPIEVTSAALELQAYASMGGPRDSVRASFARTARLIDTRIPVKDRQDVRQMLFRNAYGLAYAELAPLARFPISANNDALLAMRAAFERHDTATVRRVNRDLNAQAARFSPGTVAIDRVYRQAELLLAISDSAEAIRALDEALGSLPRSRSILLKVLPQAGTLVRAMVLRAELAWRANDRPTFERWARSAVVLWSDADPPLREPVEALRSRVQ